MENLNKNKFWIFLFFPLVCILIISFILIGFKIQHIYSFKKQFLNLQDELQSLISSSPSPIKKNVAVTNENLNQINRFRKEWDKFLGNIEHSKTPIESYLNIQTAMESILEKAKDAKITIDSKCSFGFFKYLKNEKLPNIQSLNCLDRECQVISILTQKLIDSKPLKILSFAREPVKGEIDLEEDLLNPNSFEHLKIHDIFCSNLYKLSFTGPTQTLRLFINKIQHMQIPIFIRDIEVSLYQEGKTSKENVSVFSITLEVIDFKNKLA